MKENDINQIYIRNSGHLFVILVDLQVLVTNKKKDINNSF